MDPLDLICGEVTGPRIPGTPDFDLADSNATTRVVARFDTWERGPDGDGVIDYLLQDLRTGICCRLRGTNQGVDVPNETDPGGNPLMDDLLGENTEEHAWADLWFYSSPISLQVSR